MSNVIDVNYVDESDLDYLDPNSKEITVSPNAIFYRGYDQQYKHVDTLAWYEPGRPLYYGSYEHALIYTESEEKEQYAGHGPIYRFWPKKTLKLFALNLENTRRLLQTFIKRRDHITAAQLVVAYGYLYNLKEGFTLLDELRITKVHNLVSALETGLNNALSKCIDTCELADKCREYCLETVHYIGRKSLYGIDKPLAGKLKDFLEPLGYQGIFAFVDRELTHFGNDIIIFNSPRDLASDNVNVAVQCTSVELKNCPKRVKRVPIPPKETIEGKIMRPYYRRY